MRTSTAGFEGLSESALNTLIVVGVFLTLLAVVALIALCVFMKTESERQLENR